MRGRVLFFRPGFNAGFRVDPAVRITLELLFVAYFERCAEVGQSSCMHDLNGDDSELHLLSWFDDGPGLSCGGDQEFAESRQLGWQITIAWRQALKPVDGEVRVFPTDNVIEPKLKRCRRRLSRLRIKRRGLASSSDVIGVGKRHAAMTSRWRRGAAL